MTDRDAMLALCDKVLAGEWCQTDASILARAYKALSAEVDVDRERTWLERERSRTHVLTDQNKRMYDMYCDALDQVETLLRSPPIPSGRGLTREQLIEFFCHSNKWPNRPTHGYLANSEHAADAILSLPTQTGSVPAPSPMSDGRAPTILTQDQLNDLGQRLMALTPGGSEYFNRHGDGYCVDVDACVKFLEQNRSAALELAKLRKASKIAPSPIQGAPSGDVTEFAAAAVNWLCELPDRTSPEDWPEACLVTGEELHAYLVEKLTDLLGASSADTLELLQERVVKMRGALRAMADAYVRKVKTGLTEDEIAKEPWRCAEYIVAEQLCKVPVKLHFTKEWLRKKIENDPDEGDCTTGIPSEDDNG